MINERTFLDLSTFHITVGDRTVLETIAKTGPADLPLFVYAIHDGGFIVLTCGTDSDWGYACRAGLLKAGFSLAFVELAVFCRRAGKTGLWLDVDAQVCPELPTFSRIDDTADQP
jgi:hypothetical protein